MRRRLGLLAVALAGCSTGDGLEPLQVRLATPGERTTLDVVADARPFTAGSDLEAGEVRLSARCTADEELAAG